MKKYPVILSWCIQIPMVVLFAVAGWMKLSGDAESRALFDTLGMEPAGRLIIGVLELTAAWMFLRSCTAVRGALLTLCIMVGALIAHATRIGFGGEMSEMSMMWAFAFFGSTLILAMRYRELRFLANALDR